MILSELPEDILTIILKFVNNLNCKLLCKKINKLYYENRNNLQISYECLFLQNCSKQYFYEKFPINILKKLHNDNKTKFFDLIKNKLDCANCKNYSKNCNKKPELKEEFIFFDRLLILDEDEFLLLILFTIFDRSYFKHLLNLTSFYNKTNTWMEIFQNSFPNENLNLLEICFVITTSLTYFIMHNNDNGKNFLQNLISITLSNNP